MKTIIYTRPSCWQRYRSKKFSFIYASPSPGEVVKLRNDNVAFENVGEVFTNDGISNLNKLFNKYRPCAFLWWASYYHDGTKRKVRKLSQVLMRLKYDNPNTLFLYGNGNQQGYPDFNVDAFRTVIDGILINSKDEREINMYKHYGIKNVKTFYQFGFDPKIHGPHLYNDTNVEFDVFFGGANTFTARENEPSSFYPRGDNAPVSKKGCLFRYPNTPLRIELLERIDKEYKLRVTGGKFSFTDHIKYIYGVDFLREFGKAKMIIGMNHWDLERYYTKRIIYALASGKMYMTYYIPGMEKDFENHKHLVWFKSIDEALSYIDYYLRHDDKREEIAKEGRKIALEKHSWEARFKEFEKLIEELT